MSEISQHKSERIKELENLFTDLVFHPKPAESAAKYKQLTNQLLPGDIIGLVDKLVLQGYEMALLKKGINKLLNLSFNQLNKASNKFSNPFLQNLTDDNYLMEKKLSVMKADIRIINHEINETIKERLDQQIAQLQIIEKHYSILENILFPLLEKTWTDFRCVGVMWSYHDDIRRSLQQSRIELKSETFSLSKFNQLIGNVYFTMYAMKFREEKILFQLIQDTIGDPELNRCNQESIEHGFAYLTEPMFETNESQNKSSISQEADLGSGSLLPEYIKLIFNHLPVDITFVDEHNKVKYFSQPKQRIFTRTSSILGRDVKNCHPPESVHIVEKIVDEFRKGKRDQADFWIKMKGQLLFIRYFAVHDEANQYKGVIEVTQEISEIQKLSGEKRLLDWD